MKPRHVLKPVISKLCLFLCAIVLSQLAFGSTQNQDNNTTLDLRNKSWGNGNIHSLQSSWLFAWNHFTISSTKPQNWHQVHVPGSWSHHFNEQPKSESPLPPKGFGTYYKKILVPSSIKKAYLHLPDMASAYELWHNGILLGGNGQIARDKESEKANYLPRVYELTPINGEVEIFIKTSNFHYLWGGIWYAPTITDESGVHGIREIPILKAMTSGTILLATSIFCLLMFLSRKQDRKLLFFSLFCFAIGIRRLCMDERVLYLFSDLSWNTLQSTENITLYLMLPLFLSYFQLIFPQTTSKKLPIIAWITALPFCLSALLLQVDTYSGFNPYFQLIVLLFLPLILFSWAKAFRAKLKHAKVFGLSLLVFITAVINDMLNYSYIIRTTNLTHLGVLAFVLFQLAGLVNRYWDNFRAIENLSKTLKEKNKTLVQLDEFKDDFLASTSHELRMPLHGMAGLAKTIRQESPTLSETSKNKIKLVEATAIRLGNLVNDILDISSLKHGKLNIQMSPTNISPLIESTIQSLKPLLNNKPITLDYNIEEGANAVLADEQRLQQILYNLIGNAIKFTEQGHIQVEVRMQKNAPNTDMEEEKIIQILVCDSGIGMTEEQLDTALQPYQTHSEQSESGIRGTGLGLSITKMLVELHNGTLSIRSKKDAGTTARFTLTASSNSALKEQLLEKQESPLSQDNGEETLPKTLDKNQVLLENTQPQTVCKNLLTQDALIFYADDEEVNRELVKSQLLAAGYQTQIFNDGESLLRQLDYTVPELILLDWVMPGRDGLETCIEIRKQHNASNLPIIMLTAKHQTNNVVQALNAGANDYLTKPYHEQELIARVASQVSVKRLLVTTLENERLNLEVQRQEQQKLALKTDNQRLCQTLDASPDSIIMLNEDLDLVFANIGARQLLEIEINSANSEQIKTGSTLDETIAETTYSATNFMSADSIKTLQNYINSEDKSAEFAISLNTLSNDILASATKADTEEHLISLILANKQSDKNGDTQKLLASLTQEIAENKQRMEQIESTLLRLNTSPLSSDEADTISEELDSKELVVKTLRTTLISWERYTHKTKADLAEESHCWRVYLDGATAKTRTLDKYLSVKTLPAKPRWRAVIKTANYVLDNCNLNEDDQNELNSLIQKLTDAFS